MEEPTLPNDMVVEVLKFLPVRSLVRFRCVSKEWCCLIKSSNFINNHLIQSKKNYKMLLVRRCSNLQHHHEEDVLSFHRLDSLETCRSNLSINFVKGKSMMSCTKVRALDLSLSFRVIGSCNGVICMIKDYQIILCNPALQEFNQLPLCPFDQEMEHYFDEISGVGFGMDIHTNNFKIVVIRNYHDTRDAEDGGVYSIEVQLYTTSSNSWKEIVYHGNTVEPWYAYPFNEVFFNGACHWPAILTIIDAPPIILCFDIVDEEFNKLEYPANCVLKEDKHLAIINECLSLVQHDGEFKKPYNIEVWVMKEYGIKSSWTKQFVLTTEVFGYPFPLDDDRFLLEYPHSDQLACVELRTNQIQKVGIYGEAGTFGALLYEESLISLKEVIESS